MVVIQDKDFGVPSKAGAYYMYRIKIVKEACAALPRKT